MVKGLSCVATETQAECLFALAVRDGVARDFSL